MAEPQTLEGLQRGLYKGVKRLKISSGIDTFPPEILTLSQTLEVLDLSGNTSMSALPSSISRLQKLKIAFFSNCSFTTFPAALAQCRNLEMVAFKNNHMAGIPDEVRAFPRKLRWLILTGNEIEQIPRSIGYCAGLEKCMLAGNRLRTLPENMAQCRRLGLLRLSCNRFERLPEWLFELPELAFLSFAGNPLVAKSIVKEVEEAGLEDVEWEDLEVGKLLGEGASGFISKGTWRSFNETKDVAIKLFKGELTSDGSPIDEMAACIASGQHSNLIDTLGSISSHPDQKRGLVLELIPPTYINLGLPPTMQTCTRDVFAEDMILSLEKVRSILLGIVNAAAYLHSRGISHGDLYAHNILVDKEKGHALLGDFGAATVYGQGVGRESIERLEVLAFGHLVEDLLGCVERVVGEEELDGKGILDEKSAGVLEGLGSLHWACTNPAVFERPTFEEVKETLETL